jgi:hypothetical protein
VQDQPESQVGKIDGILVESTPPLKINQVPESENHSQRSSSNF